jgi:hypothetical protein
MRSSIRGFTTLVCVLLLAACSRARVVTHPEPVRGDVAASHAVAASTPHEALAARGLVIPVEGVDASRIRDSYTAGRCGERTHDAVDIMAPRGTAVIAADSGTIFKLRQNEAGGITIYQLDPDEQFVYYYAHLDRYRDGLTPSGAAFWPRCLRLEKRKSTASRRVWTTRLTTPRWILRCRVATAPRMPATRASAKLR